MMEIQEAIQQLTIQRTFTNGSNAKVEAIDMAIQALKKQIAKKPEIEGDGEYKGQPVYDTWICPCCYKSYEIDYDNYDYCPNCGQHIDRSELE